MTIKMNDSHNQQNKYSNMESGDHESSARVEKTIRRLKPGPYSKTKVAASAESDSEIAEQSSQTFECPNENSSLELITIADPELFTVIFTRLQDLQRASAKNHSVIDLVCKTLIMNDKVMKEQAKIIDELRAALALKRTSAVVEKTSKKKKQKYEDDDNDYQVVNKKRYRKLKFVLPPEYNKNDSRWTLKHHELRPELVELMPETSVYIDAARLDHCKKFAKDCRSLARMLSGEIFTKNALTVCSVTGARPRFFHLNFVRPGLDKMAILAILDFVEELRREKGWIRQGRITIMDGIRNKITTMRRHRYTRNYDLGC